jgi:hypothetical protein
MIKYVVALCLFMATPAAKVVADVLLVADEFPAMELLAGKLKAWEQVNGRVVSQKELPVRLDAFEAVVVYIHRELAEKTEDTLIDYANGGGKLVLLHHSISSGKRNNKHWFGFLGVSLPEADLSQGGYKWIEGVSFDLVNLNPNHFIMTNRVNYPIAIQYATTNAPVRDGRLPGFALQHSEVYLNHVHNKSRTLLMGLKYADEKTGKTYLQDTAGWVMPTGKGWIVYLMPGHTANDFENPTYGRIVVNAIIWKP